MPRPRPFLVLRPHAGLGFVLALASCSAPPATTVPDHFTLSATGITVEVTSAPYSYSVKDGSGAVVLSTRGDGAGDGYGAIGWTTGVTDWGTLASPGYYQFNTTLDPYRDAYSISAVTQSKSDRLEVTLANANAKDSDARTVHLVLSLRASTLRVEASVDGAGGDGGSSTDAATADPVRAFSTAFSTAADEAFMGFGERYNHTNQRGKDVYSWPEEGGLGQGEAVLSSATDPYPNGEEMTYYPIPFFISSKGYAFWLDSTWRNEFNLATDNADAWRVWHIGPTLSYEIYVPISGDMRPYPQQLVDLFTGTVGRPMVPPKWAFGPRRRINVNAMVDGESELQKMRDLDLSLTHIDDNTHFLPDGGEVGREADLKTWVQYANSLGVRVNGYFNPYFSKDPASALAAETQTGIADDYFLRKGDGTLSEVWLISGKFVTVETVDVSSPAAVSWYQGTFQRAIDLGYNGWMYDFGEYVQPDVLSASGMTGEQFHNLFPVLYDKALHDVMERSSIAGDWLAYARSGGAGSSQYIPFVWSGDPTASFEDALGLPAMVRAGINIGLSGVPHWGSDISGYKCIPDDVTAANGELVARWIEMGSMGSDMHDEDSCSQAHSSGQKANIWNSTDAQAAWKTYAKLHTRLFPYLYTLALQAHQTGAPTMRHMFFEHPEQASLASVDDAYYLGPSLLVAPVVKRGAVTKDVPLPAENYLDWSDRKLYAGGQTVTVPAPLAKLPLFLRDGHLVPLLDASIETLDEKERSAAVVGPVDVAGVVDVVGLISPAAATAGFDVWDGTRHAAALTGALAPPGPSLPAAKSEADLATCDPCFQIDDLGGGLSRARVSTSSGSATLGGLSLSSTTAATANKPLRVRWDLYVATSPAP